MKLLKKIKKQSGFTLAETLMAVLIMLMVSTIVAQGIPVARNVYNKVVMGANAQVLLSTTVNALRSELGTAWDVKSEDETSLTYFSADTGIRSIIYMGAGDDENKIMIQEYITTDNLNTGKTGDKRSLIPEKAISDKLYVTYEKVECKDDIVTFTNLAVRTRPGGNPIAVLSDETNPKLEIRPISLQIVSTDPDA